MARKPIVIFADSSGTWAIGSTENADASVHPVSVPAGAGAAEVVESIHGVLLDLGYGGGELVLAVPSSWCLCSGISIADLPRRGLAETMLYRLEETVPLAAEELMIDFVHSGTTALGIGLRTAYVADLLESFDSRGIVITRILPAALLALHRPCQTPMPTACNVVVWETSGMIELFTLSGGRPVGWQWLPSEPDILSLRLKLQALQTQGPLRLGCINLPRPTAELLERSEDWTVVHQCEGSIEDAATQAASDMISGRATPWLNLRPHGLATLGELRPIRRPLLSAVAMLLLAGLSVAGSLLWRANGEERLARQYTSDQQQVFRELFPQQVVPRNVRARLESEERKARGLSGQHGAIPTHRPTLLLLHESLSAFPQQMRFRLLELRLSQDKLFLEGQTRTHSDAEAIAAALRQKTPYQVDAPRSEHRGDKGVTFTLSGSMAAPSSGDAR